MSIKRLYLIGNGFDKHHEVNSGYEDFYKWLIKNHSCALPWLNRLYAMSETKLWNDFEVNLGKLPPAVITGDLLYTPLLFLERNPKKEGDVFLSSSIEFYDGTMSEVGRESGSMYSEVYEAFEKWIENLDPPRLDKKVAIDIQDAKFISFNYTHTLETLYGIPSEEILYIHGKAFTRDPLIFGHDKTNKELTQAWKKENTDLEDDILENAAEELSYFYKDSQTIISKHEPFWAQLKGVKEIHVWGLSLSEIDLPYLRHLIKILRDLDVQWEFSWYTNKDLSAIDSFILSNDIKNHTKIQL